MMIGAAIGAIGSVVSGLAAMQQANYQAAIAKANAKQQRLNARLASDTSQKNTVDIGRQGAGDVGAGLAAMGATGLAMSSPSAQRNVQIFRQNVREDILREQWRGNQAWAGYQTQASISDAEAAAAKSAGGFAMMQGFLGAAGGLFRSFAGMARPTAYSPGALSIPSSRPMWGNSNSVGGYRPMQSPISYMGGGGWLNPGTGMYGRV